MTKLIRTREKDSFLLSTRKTCNADSAISSPRERLEKVKTAIEGWDNSWYFIRINGKAILETINWRIVESKDFEGKVRKSKNSHLTIQ